MTGATEHWRPKMLNIYVKGTPSRWALLIILMRGERIKFVKLSITRASRHSPTAAGATGKDDRPETKIRERKY